MALESRSLRVSFNGRTLASQANNVGSIPITRSTLQRLWLKGGLGVT